jgi:hypothetical protein
MGLRDRCKEFYQQMQRNGMLRQGNPVEDLMAFVAAEQGRAADLSLEDTMPLVLYFGSEEDRSEFIALVHEAKPGMIAKRMPGGRAQSRKREG